MTDDRLTRPPATTEDEMAAIGRIVGRWEQRHLQSLAESASGGDMAAEIAALRAERDRAVRDHRLLRQARSVRLALAVATAYRRVLARVRHPRTGGDV